MADIAKKGTILIPSGGVKHLHFVCSDPVFYPKYTKESVLVVNISSVPQDEQWYDSTCVLYAGDHPFVKYPSYVYYRKADIFGADNVQQRIDDGTFDVHQVCPDDTFSRILAGFDISEDVSAKAHHFYEKYCKMK
ncbi:hypothetical protein [Salinivibrio socompensis]|uniref:hypothetical protein n=1 Tax=Salinivibrio socompensis TaxID=1510206 RepID=UPI00046F4D39|nr:hypothetical protein [Salinivibrio socompensis]